jgi:ketosteroid isomerase-like protein
MGNHIEIVNSIYSAFGRGDVPFVLGCLDGDVQWEYAATSACVPWLAPRRGPSGVGEFFETFARELELHRFVPKQLLAAGDTVVALVDLECTVRSTGKPLREIDEAHIWYFVPSGKVIRFRHAADTHAHWLAYQK